MSVSQPTAQSAPAYRWWREVVSGRSRGPVAQATRAALAAGSALYALGLHANLALYGSGLSRRTEPALPVLSVGNLTLGGTGKTTAVQYLARRLQAEGLHPAVVLRGYRAAGMGEPILTLPPDAGHSATAAAALGPDARAREIGDEACLLCQALPGVPVGVGKRREAVIAALAAQSDASVVLLDDGFQYFRMRRLVDIVLVDALAYRPGERLFPAGHLREPWSHLRRADQIWITHADLVTSARLDELRDRLDNFAAPVVETRHELTGLRALTGEPRDLAQIAGERILAVSALGNAASFEEALRARGAEVTGLRYDDHHYYSSRDLDQVAVAARECAAQLIAITAKDAVKWPAGEIEVPVAIVDCSLQITEGEPLVAALVAEVRRAVSGTDHGN